jgi:hypothetical protein
MKKHAVKALYTVCAVLALFSLVSCGSSSSDDDGDLMIIDHKSLDADRIPDSVITAIKNLDVYFEHASVGSNVVEGLETMAASARYSIPIGHGSSPVDSAMTDWYDTNNGFLDVARGNPGFSDKIDLFDTSLRTAGFASHLDVASFKYCYIDNDFNGIAGGASAAFNATKNVMESLESAYPAVTFFWWTMPLETTGDSARDQYNALVREYCRDNGKYLLDIADIECHTPSGAPVTNSGYEALCSAYTTDGGHLNNTTGQARIAAAWWVLMARIVGW